MPTAAASWTFRALSDSVSQQVVLIAILTMATGPPYPAANQDSRLASAVDGENSPTVASALAFPAAQTWSSAPWSASFPGYLAAAVLSGWTGKEQLVEVAVACLLPPR